MGKKTKIWLLVAVSLFLGGCILFGVAMTMLNWDFNRLSTIKYETNQYEITDDYLNITIVSKTADITFAVSEDGKHRVICHEQENAIHSVEVKDSDLVIELVDTRKWHEHLGISFTSPKITVYLPREQYGNLSIRVSTGDVSLAEDFSFENINISVSTGKIHVKDLSTGALELSVSTGKTSVANVTCESLTSKGSTGDVDLKNVIATGAFFIERSTGDIELERCDAATLYLKTSTGDIEGSLRSEKEFSVHTKTGDVEVPRSSTGGTCELYTSTGDIEIEIER